MLKSESKSPARDVDITKQKQPFFLYLFYEHFGDQNKIWCYGLYKFVVNLNESTTYDDDSPSPILMMEFPTRDYDEDPPPVVNPPPNLMIIPTQKNYILRPGMRRGPSPILVFQRRDRWEPKGMRCARLGSKLYFLGGTVEEKYEDIDYPRDVFVFDIATGKIKLMDVLLHAGKPRPCAVFAANGKLYALGRIPYFSDYMPSAQVFDELSKMKLFECYDPSTNKWEVLENLPSMDTSSCSRCYGIKWVAWNVLEKRQQVALIGRLDHYACACFDREVKFVYHIQENKWTCHRLPLGSTDASVALSFQEADDGYLYSLPRNIAQPLKSKTDYVSVDVENALFSDEEDSESVVVDGVVEMSSPHMSKPKLHHWFFKMILPYCYSNIRRFLLYAGNGYLCYLCIGLLPINRSYEFGGKPVIDPNTRGITITLLKEEEEEEIKQEKQDCFRARILHSKLYVIETPFVFGGGLERWGLEGCFVVTPEEMQRRLNRKEKKKKKKQNVTHA